MHIESSINNFNMSTNEAIHKVSREQQYIEMCIRSYLNTRNIDKSDVTVTKENCNTTIYMYEDKPLIKVTRRGNLQDIEYYNF